MAVQTERSRTSTDSGYPERIEKHWPAGLRDIKRRSAFPVEKCSIFFGRREINVDRVCLFNIFARRNRGVAKNFRDFWGYLSLVRGDE